MTIAIVENGVFKHTIASGKMVRDSKGVMRPRAKDISEGWYEFIPARNAAPAGQKAQGTTFTVDDVAGTVTESFLYVDLTAEEMQTNNNDPLLSQIAALETQQLLPRIVRDLAKKSLAEDAVTAGITLDDLYASAANGTPAGIAYKKFKDFDDQIKALRERLI